MSNSFEDILAAIREAGDKGLSHAKIRAIWPGKSERQKKARLSDLNARLASAAREGVIRGPFKTSNSKLYFGPGRGPTLEKVTALISGLVLQSGVRLLSKTGFEKLIKAPDKEYIADALRNAVSERLIAELTSGRSKLYLHRDVAEERFGFQIEASASASSPQTSGPASFGMAAFLPIYRRLKAEQGGLPAVRIFDVIRLSGADRAAVHKLLIAEQRSGRVTIHQSNSIDLPGEVIDAGIRVEGFAQPYINVVVKEDP